MKHECKITVLETKVFSEYQEKYLADPKSGPCPCFKAGDTFLLQRTNERDDFYHLMDGKFCGEAWDAISRYVYTTLVVSYNWDNTEKSLFYAGFRVLAPIFIFIKRSAKINLGMSYIQELPGELENDMAAIKKVKGLTV